MNQLKVNLSELQIGDIIGIHIDRYDGGAVMCPSYHGKKQYYKEVAFAGTLGDGRVCHAYYIDTLEPLGLPICASEIFKIIKQDIATIEIMKQIFLKQALTIGRWAIKQYVDTFNQFPFQTGICVKINNYGDYSYQSINKQLGITNEHKVLTSKNLLLTHYENGIITLKDIVTGKSAKTGMCAISSVKNLTQSKIALLLNK